MTGIFYGVGVGPGDPELLTVKAIKTITKCDVLAIPVSYSGWKKACYEAGGTCRYPDLLKGCTAYKIISSMVPGIGSKAKLYLPMPMLKDKERLKAIHDNGAAKVAELLDNGRNVAFITLGDPAVYSTCRYIHKRMRRKGYETVLVPGVTSFCAAAAALDSGLVENSDQLHVIPGSYALAESLKLPGTKVLMKTGSKMPVVKEAIRKCGGDITMIENCGMECEAIYHGVENIPDDAGYYSLIMIKEEER